MAYTPFKMKGNPMKRNFGIGAAPAKMKKSPMKKDDKTLVAKSDSMDVAHDKFMKKRMEDLMKKAQKSSDSLGTVRNKVINKAVDKKTEAIDKQDSRSKQKKMTTDLGKEISDLNKKRSGMKMKKKSPTKMVKRKGGVKKGRSETPGPIVADTRVSRKTKTSKSIGPAESPKAIKAKASKVLSERKKAEKNNPGGFMPESKESVAAKKEYDSARSFLKMKKKSAMKMKKKSPSKMKKKSPAKKPLVGKQKNLPEGLKKKILAAPSKMKKGSSMKMMKKK